MRKPLRILHTTSYVIMSYCHVITFVCDQPYRTLITLKYMLSRYISMQRSAVCNTSACMQHYCSLTLSLCILTFAHILLFVFITGRANWQDGRLRWQVRNFNVLNMQYCAYTFVRIIFVPALNACTIVHQHHVVTSVSVLRTPQLRITSLQSLAPQLAPSLW